MLVAVVVADRIATGLVGPTRALAATAQRLASGELEACVTPAGPPYAEVVGRSTSSPIASERS